MNTVLERELEVHRLPGGELRLETEVGEKPAGTLFEVGARRNPKRAFLFVSRVLGKHLPVSPETLRWTHAKLACGIGALRGPVMFVGMAETATGLGQGVFEAWIDLNGPSIAAFIHTSRYRTVDCRQFEFAEPHSHAPRQFLNVASNESCLHQLRETRSVVLVDDEISTGTTFANLAALCAELCPHVERFVLVTLTDFMGAERRSSLGERFGYPVKVVSLMKGQWAFSASGETVEAAPLAQVARGAEVWRERSGFGREGIGTALKITDSLLEAAASLVARESRVLVLGTGEFMHAAAVLAEELQTKTGCSCWTHATTRSPIEVFGPIESVRQVQDVYGEGVPNYVYNFDRSDWDVVFLVCESGGDFVLKEVLAKQLGARLVDMQEEKGCADGRIY